MPRWSRCYPGAAAHYQNGGQNRYRHWSNSRKGRLRNMRLVWCLVICGMGFERHFLFYVAKFNICVQEWNAGYGYCQTREASILFLKYIRKIAFRKFCCMPSSQIFVHMTVVITNEIKINLYLKNKDKTQEEKNVLEISLCIIHKVYV